jgi:hypothetical protein
MSDEMIAGAHRRHRWEQHDAEQRGHPPLPDAAEGGEIVELDDEIYVVLFDSRRAPVGIYHVRGKSPTWRYVAENWAETRAMVLAQIMTRPDRDG